MFFPIFPINPVFLFSAILFSFVILRFLSKTWVLFFLQKCWQCFEEKWYIHQYYKIPQFDSNLQENKLFRKVEMYLNSIPFIEDSHFANLFSGNKSNEIELVLDCNQTVIDNFLGAKLHWVRENCEKTGEMSLVLKMKKVDKRRVLRRYLQHIETVYGEIENRRKEAKLKLFVNVNTSPERNGRWRSIPFSHPATMDSVLMDVDLKSKVKSDLEAFLKSKQYYHRLGRVWKRSYLLYGPSGTGKSTFVTAMAKFLSYDVYDLDLFKIFDGSDLKMLLLQTANRSLIVVEDLDRYLEEKSTAGNLSLSGILNFMDGILSCCCGEERVMVFTMNRKDQIDPTVLRPGRIDVHIYFPVCDFTAFKTLANSHLGLKDHKLFSQVEEMFQTGSSLSPAEICEIMISNRTSPTRALKTVLTALQSDGRAHGADKIGRVWSNKCESGRVVEDGGKSGASYRESGHSLKDIRKRKLYGLFKMRRTNRKESFYLDAAEKKI